MKLSRLLIVAALVLACLPRVDSAFAGQTYQLYDLGSTGFGYCRINNLGQVAVELGTADSPERL